MALRKYTTHVWLKQAGLAFGFSLLSFGCGGDAGPTQPPEEPQQPPLSAGDTVSALVGPEGGVVRHPSGATVEVPAGSFSGPAVISLTLTTRLPGDAPPATNAFRVAFAPPTSTTASSHIAQAGSSTGTRIASLTEPDTYSIQLDFLPEFKGTFDGETTRPIVTISTRNSLFYPLEQRLNTTADWVASRLTWLGDATEIVIQGFQDDYTDCLDDYDLSLLTSGSSQSLPRPVVYIHGWQALDHYCTGWQPLNLDDSGREVFDHLTSAGLTQHISFWYYTYPTMLHIDQAAQDLANRLDAVFPNRSDVVLIGHSMGALVARAAFSLHGAHTHVERVITLGGPLKGSPLARPELLETYRNDIVKFLFLNAGATLDPEDILLIDGIKEGLIHYLLHTTGAKDLAPTSEIVTKVNSVRFNSNLGLEETRFFTFGGNVDRLGPWPCGHGWGLCWAARIGWGLFHFVDAAGEPGSTASDGIVPLGSSLPEHTNRQEPGHFGYAGYDHWELRRGDFQEEENHFLVQDPVLTRVAELVEELIMEEAQGEINILGGTYFDRGAGLSGSSFLYDPQSAAGPITSVDVDGPLGWNDDEIFSLGLGQPRGIAENRSVWWHAEIAPVSGEYSAEATVDSEVLTGSFAIDASSSLPAPEITSIEQPTLGQVDISWSSPARAESCIIRVNPWPFTGVTDEEVVPCTAGFHSLSGLSLEAGAEYQGVVFALSHDIITPGKLSAQFNMGVHGVIFRATECEPGVGPSVFASSLSGLVSSPGPPSDLYTVEVTECGLDTHIDLIRTADGTEPPITDIAHFQDGPIFAITETELYKVDPETAIAELIGDLGVDGVVALTFDAEGSLFGATQPAFGVGSGDLLLIDTETGQATVVGSLGSGFDADGDIAFAPDGTLFGSISSGTDVVLVRIDPNTGAASRLGDASIGFDNVWGLVFVDDQLFGLSADSSGEGYLIRLNVDDGTGSEMRRLTFNASGAAATVSPGR